MHGAGPTLSYAELDTLSERLAERLIALGVGPERLVALLMQRTSALIVTLYAVAKAGGAHLPLDPAHPPERLAFMLDDAAPALVITDAVPDAALVEGHRVLVLDPDDLPGQAPRRTERSALRAADAAYAIFTSGSTGRPKSVLVTHRGVMNMVAQQIRHFRVGETSRVLQCASIGFDAAFSEIAMALCSGARLELASSAELAPGPPLAATAAERAVTHLTITPSALAALEPDDLPSVTTLIVAGEACPPNLVDRWAAGRRMVNAYGPTETTVCATMSDPLTGGPPPIGRPLDGTSLEVLDERLSPLPAGEVGELWAGGLGVARGYLGRPGLTAERFVADPRGKPGSRMYRTGDLGRVDEAGVLWFTGRDDDQVKIRGHRVDLGEVAAVLGEHPSVRDVRVVAQPDAHGSNRLAAYVVSGDPATVETLRAWVRRRLPEAMVPAVIVPLDRLPLTGHGKLDLAALRAPERDGAAAAAGAAVRLMCDLFADTLDLGAPGCGPDDDFFDLGGHSLLGALLLGRVRTVFGVRLTLPALVQAPTPRALAERLAGPKRAPGLGEVLALRPRGEAAPVFCLPPAVGLGWCYGRVLRAIDPAYPVYTVQTPGLRDGEPPAASMTELVEHCVRVIRRTRPDGPYHLLGWSFGGVLAHAVAVALHDAGARVGMLAVLDGYPGRGGTLAALPRRSGHSGTAIRSVQQADPAELDKATARELLADSLGTDVPYPDRLVDLLRAHVRLQRTHQPGVFDGPMTVFTAEHPGERPDPATWHPYLSEPPRVLPVPAGHHDLLGPAALAVIAPALAELLGGPTAEPAAAGGTEPTTEPRRGTRPDPFDGPCHVLRNDAGQYCLWPAAQPVPAGWQITLAERDRAACVAFVEQAWTDPMLLGEPNDRV